MKLLEFPAELCDHVMTEFYCETWDQFDQTCAWLIKNGVPLKYGPLFEEKMIRIENRMPRAAGKLLQYDPTGGSPRYAKGEEMGIEYEVHMPDYIR